MRVTARTAAACTATGSMPSTGSAGTPRASALRQTSCCASAWAQGMPIEYRLFSQTKSTGRRHSAERFSVSWNTPSPVAPSPNRQAVTAPRPRRWSAKARPAASGSPPPTMALPPTKRVAASNTCIEPPRPRQQPSRRPSISAISAGIGTPRASACPCSR